MRYWLIAVLLNCLAVATAIAQGCGSGNPNCIVSTRPIGDNSNAAASTGFIYQGQVIAPTANSLNQALNIAQSPAGSASTNTFFNSLAITDTTTITGLNFGVGLNIVHNYGGNSAEGGREALQAAASLTSTSSASSSNRNYVGVVGIGQTIANDNGTDPSSNSTSAGAFFGGNFVGAALNSAATALLNLTGAEFNTSMVSGSSVWAKSLAQFSSGSGDRVQGTVVDSMLWFYNQSASNPGWNDGILFDGTNGTWPIKSTGTILAAIGGGTTAHGIDFSGITCSIDCFKSNGFAVDGSGIITGAGILASSVGIRTQATTVSGLPGCVAGLKGLRMFVTDATSTTFHSTAAGSGSNNMAVVCDGTNWYLD